MGRLTHHNTPGPVRAATSQRHGSCIIASVVADGTGGGACRPANGSIAATRPLSGRDHGAHMLPPPPASFCALSQQEARLEPSPPTTPALRRGGDAIVVVVPIPLRGGPGRGGGARAILVHGDHRVRRAPHRRASPEPDQEEDGEYGYACGPPPRRMMSRATRGTAAPLGGRIRIGTSRLRRRRPSSPGRRCSRLVSCSSRRLRHLRVCVCPCAGLRAARRPAPSTTGRRQGRRRRNVGGALRRRRPSNPGRRCSRPVSCSS